MAKGDAKANPWVIVVAHHRSYLDVSTGRARWQDWAWIDVLPVVIAVGCFLGDVRLSAVAAAGMLTVAGLLSAFLFGLMIQVADRAENWADTNPPPGADTTAHATYLVELAANAGYASLVSICAAIACLVASLATHELLRVTSALALGLGAHLVLTLFMAMKRVFAVTVNRAIAARGGAGITDREPFTRRGAA